MKKDSLPPSPAAQPAAAAPTFPSQPPLSNASDPSQIQAQEEYLRQILRAQPQAENGTPQEQAEDPMAKMLQQLLGGMDPNDPNAAEMPKLSPDDISKATGIPSWITNMVLGKPPETEQRKKQAFMWKIIHLVFAVLIGIYTVWTVTTSMATFGANPPTPPTLRNPFLIFTVGELLVETTRLTLRGMGSPKGIGAWYQIVKDVGRDGSIVIFLLGVSMWWNE